mmetsp:Transcript_7253/g.26352  ORF Transcript_7253/g.26352 Transcript_7253/m.26352 type:complete len:246 (+) Transcript_7253:614-1351(+)
MARRRSTSGCGPTTGRCSRHTPSPRKRRRGVREHRRSGAATATRPPPPPKLDQSLSRAPGRRRRQRWALPWPVSSRYAWRPWRKTRRGWSARSALASASAAGCRRSRSSGARRGRRTRRGRPRQAFFGRLMPVPLPCSATLQTSWPSATTTTPRPTGGRYTAAHSEQAAARKTGGPSAVWHHPRLARQRHRHRCSCSSRRQRLLRLRLKHQVEVSIWSCNDRPDGDDLTASPRWPAFSPTSPGLV